LPVKGEIGQVIPVERVRYIQVRRNGPSTLLRIQIGGEEVQEVRVLSDSCIEEIIGEALVGLELQEIESYTLMVKPLVLEDGATFKFAKKMKPYLAILRIDYQTLRSRL
jgi:hypothetical protein